MTPATGCMARADAVVQAGERIVVLALIACGVLLIVVPLLLTLYLSLFDEKLIVFPPRGYTPYPAYTPCLVRALHHYSLPLQRRHTQIRNILLKCSSSYW